MNTLYIGIVIKSYNCEKILSNVYLTCNNGEIIGLFGRNGSGKSTLLKIIFGSIKSDSKFIKVGENRISTLFHSRNQIKYLSQDISMPSHLKINKIIKLFCKVQDYESISNHKLIVPFLNKKKQPTVSWRKKTS